MRLGDFKRLEKQNFEPEFQELIEVLAYTVNNDVEVLYNVLKRKVSLKDNIFCMVKDIAIVVDSLGIPEILTQFRLEDPNMKILGCQVLKVINQDNTLTYPTSAPFISFTQNSGVITINHITGLHADTNYLVTIVGWGN